MPERKRTYHRKWHEKARKNPEVRELWNKRSAEWRAKNRIKANLHTRDFNRRVKRLCLDKYGSVCQCCGEDKYEFLAIDHINGGGIKHRKENNIKTVYGWLKKNNFPQGFRVLCHNCNCALGHFGYCPHKDLVRHQDLLNSLVLPKPTPPSARNTLELPKLSSDS